VPIQPSSAASTQPSFYSFNPTFFYSFNLTFILQRQRLHFTHTAAVGGDDFASAAAAPGLRYRGSARAPAAAAVDWLCYTPPSGFNSQGSFSHRQRGSGQAIVGIFFDLTSLRGSGQAAVDIFFDLTWRKLSTTLSPPSPPPPLPSSFRLSSADG
jgi:hypothetical protein